MASTIQLKRGSGAPTSGDLATGELGLDLTNNRIYSSTDGTDIVELGTNPTDVNVGTLLAVVNKVQVFAVSVLAYILLLLESTPYKVSPT